MMSTHQASRTALGTAYLRAAHQVFEKPPRIFDDPVALPLLGPNGLKRIKDTAESYRTPERLALRAHVVLRSRFAEDRLEAAVRRGVAQYVILGAGFDTFALRQPPWARSLKIVEVDHPGTQNLKRSLISAAGFSVPGNVTLTNVDFEHESLLDGLLRNGVKTGEPAFFSWLGVTMYLGEDAIDAVIRSVSAFPAGSEMVLTFVQPQGGSPSPLARRTEDLGEPWVSCFTPEAMESKLRRFGFSGVEFLSPADADERYFKQQTSELPVPGQTNIVCASIEASMGER